MDKKTAFLFLTLFLLIILSVSTLFYKSVVLQDFDIVDIEK